MNKKLKQVIKHWAFIEPFAVPPKNKKEYDELLMQLDELLDHIADNEKHPLMPLVDIISEGIADYEQKKIRMNGGSGVDALKYLMQEYQLKQSDLADIASQGVISEILNGKRQLNLNQIKKLAQKFQVSPETFI